MRQSASVQETHPCQSEYLSDPQGLAVVVPKRVVLAMEFEGEVAKLRKRVPHVNVEEFDGEAA